MKDIRIRNTYQNKSINAEKSHKDAAIYCSGKYLFLILDVWYKIDADASKIIQELNNNHRLNQKRTPAITNPIAIKVAIIILERRKEKSFFTVKATIDSHINNIIVSIVACDSK